MDKWLNHDDIISRGHFAIYTEQFMQTCISWFHTTNNIVGWLLDEKINLDLMKIFPHEYMMMFDSVYRKNPSLNIVDSDQSLSNR